MTNVELNITEVVSEDEGATFQSKRKAVYWFTLPEELKELSQAVGLHEVMWGVSKDGIRANRVAVDILEGLLKLRSNNSSSYESHLHIHLSHIVSGYLNACINYPQAIVEIKER
jgi:hypothetical protein